MPGNSSSTALNEPGRTKRCIDYVRAYWYSEGQVEPERRCKAIQRASDFHRLRHSGIRPGWQTYKSAS